jgi:hypothetical protein
MASDKMATAIIVIMDILVSVQPAALTVDDPPGAATVVLDADGIVTVAAAVVSLLA